MEEWSFFPISKKNKKSLEGNSSLSYMGDLERKEPHCL